MTETSFFWGGSSVGDATLAPYSDDEFTDYMRDILLRDRTIEGVINTEITGYSGKLEVTRVGNTLFVATGVGFVDGKLYRNDASISLSIAVPGAGVNYYTVILRKSFANQTVRAVLLGPSGAGFPAVTQIDGTTWEIEIARCSVGVGPAYSLEDRRTFISNTTFSTEQPVSLPDFGSAIIGGRLNTASGQYSVAIGGSENIASEVNSVAMGDSAESYIDTSFAHGGTSLDGSRVQYLRLLLTKSNAAMVSPTWYNLAVADFSTLEMPDDAAWNIQAFVTGASAHAAQCWGYRVEGVASCHAAAATLHWNSVTALYEADASYECEILVPAANGVRIRVRNNGGTAYTTTWTAVVHIAEVYKTA